MTWNVLALAVRCLAFCVLATFAGAAAGQVPPPPLQRSALPLRLTGVMVDDKVAANSSCLVRCLQSEERPRALRAGEIACEVAEIRQIREDGIVVRNLAANRLEFLAFPLDARNPATRAAPLPTPAAPSPTASAHAPAEATDAATTVNLPKAAVDRYLSNLSEVLQSALAVPHYAETDGRRTMDGFEISRIKEGGAAERAGLRNGDVLLEVNGQALDSMSTVMGLFGQVASMTQARLIVLRGAERVPLTINVK